MSLDNPVRALNAETARKIAAGEVIDRPNAILRELIDNSIDSKATSITVEIQGGGITKVRLQDNGCGMTREDLVNCARPHATSKISNENDLLKLSTLGFRGEALASIAAVCRLSIVSSGFKMRASITEDHIIEQTTPLEGTIVCAEGLFENIPARRIFLKREASEALMCKTTFIEKALPWPEIGFRFINDGVIKLDLKKGQSLKERFIQANGYKEDESLFYEVSLKHKDYNFKIIIGEPGVFRTNKKEIAIFVNGRRIQEFSLVQAIEYGCKGYFPNGTFPVAGAFINIDPSLVDFNIHPAKKEVRFKDIGSLHHSISQALNDFFKDYTHKTLKEDLTVSSPSYDELFAYGKQREDFSSFKPKESYSSEKFTSEKCTSPLNSTYNKLNKYSYTKSDWTSKEEPIKLSDIAYEDSEISDAQELTEEKETTTFNSEEIRQFMSNTIELYNKEIEPKASLDESFHFLGSCLGTFLVAEMQNQLYLIDKHAAHERMLFDQIMKEKDKKQELLIPYIIETKDDNEEEYMKSIQEDLKKLGFECESSGDHKWSFKSLNHRWKGNEGDLEEAIFGKQMKSKDILYSIAAMTACKAAVKDGYVLDDKTAETIARGALSLEDPHCPHGRPCYLIFTKDKLFELIRRTR